MRWENGQNQNWEKGEMTKKIWEMGKMTHVRWDVSTPIDGPLLVIL
jgi:hypothetical protein